MKPKSEIVAVKCLNNERKQCVAQQSDGTNSFSICESPVPTFDKSSLNIDARNFARPDPSSLRISSGANFDHSLIQQTELAAIAPRRAMSTKRKQHRLLSFASQLFFFA
jgi:hypothetical protein